MHEDQELAQHVAHTFSHFKRGQDDLVSFLYPGNPRTGFGKPGSYSCDQRLELMRARCQAFAECTQHANRFDRMDALLSQQIYYGLDLGDRAKTDPEEVREYACSLLRRLPKQPMELPDYAGIQEACRAGGTSGLGLPTWTDLDLAHRPSSTILRFALTIASSRTGSHAVDTALYGAGQAGYLFLVTDCMIHIKETAEMLEVASAISKSAQSLTEQRSYLLVRAFLWTNWSRMATLWLHHQLGIHLKELKFQHNDQHDLNLRLTFPAPDVTVTDLVKQLFAVKPQYLCDWSFALLKAQRAAVTGDLRTFMRHYDALFGSKKQRCNPAAQFNQCDGVHPERCKRFIDMPNVQNQSAHDSSCSGNCTRLYWDESSWRSGNGGQAVDINHTPDGSGRIRYMPATAQTMAVSHVWIGGMKGGRPGEGMNSCLHNRFATIAHRHGCDSYWMDTPCVPTEDDLRKQAMAHINTIFASSRLTLVCDQDIQTVDISQANFDNAAPDSKTVECAEEILSALLVCDWNVRAWTFLESVKGRNNLVFLFKDNRTLPILQVLKTVHEHGAIDLAVLALNSPHLFPWQGFTEKQMRKLDRSDGDSALRLEEAGSLLSYRPARRSKDDLIIWSLLIKDIDTPFRDPKQFWRSRIGTSIWPGFLISSAPRMKEKGLSWAPRAPYALPSRDEAESQPFYRAYEGKNTRQVTITEAGLKGSLLFFSFPTMKWHGNMDRAPSPSFSLLPGGYAKTLGIGRSRREWLAEYPTDCAEQLETIRNKYLRHYRFGMLCLPYRTEVDRSNYTDSNNKDIAWRLRRPNAWATAFSATSNDAIARYEGLDRDTLVVVCGTSQFYHQDLSPLRMQIASGDDKAKPLYKADVKWKWLGVYQWPEHVPLPPFVDDEVLIA